MFSKSDGSSGSTYRINGDEYNFLDSVDTAKTKTDGSQLHFSGASAYIGINKNDKSSFAIMKIANLESSGDVDWFRQYTCSDNSMSTSCTVTSVLENP